jgi:prepilin-type N-terminal cleavage/methylation domain-containing protein
VPVLCGFRRSAKQGSEASTRRAEESKADVVFFGSGASSRHTGKKQPGFTLVEVIVVIVIIAILAAIGVPALTGYIDKAQDKNYIVEARDYFIAARSEIVEAYTDGELAENLSAYESLDNFISEGLTKDNGLRWFGLWHLSGYALDNFYDRVSGLLSKEDRQTLRNAHDPGWWDFAFVGSSSANMLNADGFLFVIDTSGTSEEFVVATYKLADGLDFAGKQAADITAEKLLSDGEYDPDAGYSVYHITATA